MTTAIPFITRFSVWLRFSAAARAAAKRRASAEAWRRVHTEPLYSVWAAAGRPDPVRFCGAEHRWLSLL
jgi:hypothetical protein